MMHAIARQVRHAAEKKGHTGKTFRFVHSLHSWDRKAGKKVPSRKRLKALSQELHRIYGW